VNTERWELDPRKRSVGVALRLAYSGPLRVAVVLFWLLATVIVALGAALGLLPVLLLAPVLLFLAYGTARRWHWVLVSDVVLTGGQGVAVIGSAIELARGGADKAGILQPTGVAHFDATLLNLTVSLLALVLFAWTVVRLARARPDAG